MKLVKTLNNNVAIARDEDGAELVVIGLGIGYIKRGEEISPERIERTFASVEQKSQLEQLVDSISPEYVELAIEIVDYAQDALGLTLADSIYIALADHLSYIHERMQKGLLPKNSLTWEIKSYYPKEFKLGRKAVELLEDEFNGSLNDDEAASIALHIINAEVDGGSLHESMDALKLMDQVMQIIRYQTHLTMDEDDLDYQRLLVHVRFFVQRVMGEEHDSAPTALFKMVRESYPEAYSVAERVRAFVEGKVGRRIADDEITYLIIHIARLMEKH